MTQHPIISLDNIYLRRGGKDILRGVSWRIAHGEHWALIGPNGSGKTTLLKVIAGYEWPTSGAVTVLGHRFGACNLPEVRKHIGWVSNALTDHVPGGDAAQEVVASGLEASFGLFREYSDEELAQAREAMARMSVSEIAGRPYGVLSQGERQRVLIARALVGGPSLLILDEPCAGLDPVSRHHFLADLGRLTAHATAPTILFVTHHIEEIEPWISNVLLLHDGRAHVSGPAADVLTPAHLTAAFGQHCIIERRNGRHYLFPVKT